MTLHPDIKIGSILKDNNPRQEGRTIRVDRLAYAYVYGIAYKSGKGVRITGDRIHCDGKARKTGFSLVREGDAS